MSQFNFEAKVRTDLGKSASRRLRRENKFIPAIIYGGTAEPQSIALEQREFYRILELDDAVYTSVLNLKIDGKADKVIIKDMQRHPFKTNTIMHIDFQRVDNKTKVNILVPFQLENEENCVGVKNQGGMLLRQMNDVEITALPQDLPDNLVVDVANLEVGQTIHLSDIKLPKGVEIITVAHGHDSGVVTVNAKRGGSDEEDEADAAAEDEKPAAE